MTRTAASLRPKADLDSDCEVGITDFLLLLAFRT
jgi:hypothetical protein